MDYPSNSLALDDISTFSVETFRVNYLKKRKILQSLKLILIHNNFKKK